MNTNLRDTAEQDELRDLFIPSHGRRNPTTACPCCLPGHKDKSAYFFERGTVSGPSGETLVAMKCNNCGYIRVSKKRISKAGPTPAQQRSINRIERYFRDKANGPLFEFRVEETDYGTFWIYVQTDGPAKLWTNYGGMISVGRRGTVKTATVYEMTSDRAAAAAHYDYMLRN